MELTNKQSEGLKLAVNRYRAGEKFTVISGWAGTGKSTLIKYIVAALGNEGINPDTDVVYTAFTGKAVQVMIDKGNSNALTLHKLLYQSRPLPNGKFVHVPKSVLEYKIVICDECGMVPADMVQLLIRHNVYIIFCGDSGQLPPVSKDTDNHLLDHPHIMLTEIMRQAADSGIIQLSMKIRNGESIDGFKSNDAIVIAKNELQTDLLPWADIILCGTNATRKSVNSQCRDLKGFKEPICQGDKIICLRNDWEQISENGNALTNGCIGTLTNHFESYIQYPPKFKVKNNQVPIIQGIFTTETNDCFGNIEMDKQCLLTGEPFLNSIQKYSIGRSQQFSSTLPHEFTYGYCITTHKSQGSEWDKVLVLEERFPFDKEEHKRWLYTATTRAASRLVLVR